MSEHIIPFFKAGDYEGGILAGTRALAQMALGGHNGTTKAFVALCIDDMSPIFAVFTCVAYQTW